jgi:protein SCO1/2
LSEVTVTEHLNDRVPSDVMFRDEHGNRVRFGQYFDGRRPVVLQLAYFRCPMLCSMVTNALLQVVRQTQWTIGNQFDVITLSIDPTEGPAEATQKKQWALDLYRRQGAENGWHFLTGDEASIRRIASAVGFGYHYDARQNQYAHPAVVMLLTPEARVARYLYGIQFNPNDMRVGLLEASQGHSISTVDRLILFCYHYDPQGRRYVLVAMQVMKIGGAATMILLGGFLAVLWARERRRRPAGAENPYRGHSPTPPSSHQDDRS